MAELQPVDAVDDGGMIPFGVERLVPGHCAGWKGTHRLAQAMPEAFIQPSVGTTLRF